METTGIIAILLRLYRDSGIILGWCTDNGKMETTGIVGIL